MADQFKYKLNELLLQLPKVKNTEWVASELEKEGISKRTFFQHKAIKLSDRYTIPAKTLLIYAKFFAVTVEDLFTYSKKIKPACERKVKA